MSRLLPLLAMLALTLAPFGRMAAAEASAIPHHQGATMGGHCSEMPAPDSDQPAEAIDCMIACAAMAPAAAPDLAAVAPAAAAEAKFTPGRISGLSPESDPPPPRFS